MLDNINFQNECKHAAPTGKPWCSANPNGPEAIECKNPRRAFPNDPPTDGAALHSRGYDSGLTIVNASYCNGAHCLNYESI